MRFFEAPSEPAKSPRLRVDSLESSLHKKARVVHMQATKERRDWVDVCDYQRLQPGRGVCALVAGEQVAIFRVAPGDELLAISNYDPFSKAFVLSRGIVGSKGDVVKVASPVYKQNFDLRTGRCLDDPSVQLRTYPVKVEDRRVKVGVLRGTARPSSSPPAITATASPSQPATKEPPARATQGPLTGRTIALVATRELALLHRMLEEKGATTISYPIVRIADSPDTAPIEAFLRDLATGNVDAVILSTGEGVRRLLGFAARMGLRGEVMAALTKIVTVARGPKPARALRELGLLPTIAVEQPTTEGVIDALQSRTWQGARVGVQLCGEKPNLKLFQFLKAAGAAAQGVAPYVYAPASGDDKIAQLIRHMSMGEVDAVAFTCSAQVDRLFAVAKSHSMDDTLRRGLRRTQVAALGPVVAAALRDRDCRVDIIPDRSFFMRSLVKEIVTSLRKSKS